MALLLEFFFITCQFHLWVILIHQKNTMRINLRGGGAFKPQLAPRLSPIKGKKGQRYFNDYYICKVHIPTILGVCSVSWALSVKLFLGSGGVCQLGHFFSLNGYKKMQVLFFKFKILFKTLYLQYIFMISLIKLFSLTRIFSHYFRYLRQ